jgi:hypothetical protein
VEGQDYSVGGGDYSISEHERKKPEKNDHPDGWRDYVLHGSDYADDEDEKSGPPEIM